MDAAPLVTSRLLVVNKGRFIRLVQGVSPAAYRITALEFDQKSSLLNIEIATAYC